MAARNTDWIGKKCDGNKPFELAEADRLGNTLQNLFPQELITRGYEVAMQKNKPVKIPPAGFRFHEAANIFPMMGEEELQQLIADIEKNDLRERIAVVGDQIIDGRNRYQALRRLGIDNDSEHYRDIAIQFTYRHYFR